jgi:hypothetical protein
VKQLAEPKIRNSCPGRDLPIKCISPVFHCVSFCFIFVHRSEAEGKPIVKDSIAPTVHLRAFPCIAPSLGSTIAPTVHLRAFPCIALKLNETIVKERISTIALRS